MPVMIISLSIEIYCTNIVYIYIYIYKIQLIPYFICYYYLPLFFYALFSSFKYHLVILLFQHLIELFYYFSTLLYCNAIYFHFTLIIIQLFDFSRLMIEFGNIS